MKNIFIAVLLIHSMIFAQSINKKYFVEEKISGGSSIVGEYNTVEYSIKSRDEKLLYKISNKTDYDIPYSGIKVFNNGCSVLISAFHGTLTFYTNNGTKLKEIIIRENVGVEYERSIKSVVDVNSLLISYEDQSKNPSMLQKYNYSGLLEKSFEIEETNINGLAYSESLNQIYISSVVWDNSGTTNKIISLINEDGYLLKSYIANFEMGFFTENDQFIAFSNNYLLSINAENLEISLQNELAKDELYLDVIASKGLIFAITAKLPKLKSGKWFYKNPTIIKLDSSGKLIEKKEVEVNSFSEFSFMKTNEFLRFSAGSEIIAVE